MKKLGTILALGIFALPALASADTTSQLTSLYQEVISVLERELQLLSPDPSLSIEPASGTVPFTTVFTLHGKTGTEAVDFGDGHSTGSNGCVLNALGFCDLGDQLVHTYHYPATYVVTLYRYLGNEPIVVSTSSVAVSLATSSSAR